MTRAELVHALLRGLPLAVAFATWWTAAGPFGPEARAARAAEGADAEDVPPPPPQKIPDSSVRALPEDERRIPLDRFELAFADDFDGDKLDTDLWEVPHWERQGTSTWHSRNVSVHDGSLWIAVHLTDDPVLRYDTAGIRTGNPVFLDDAKFKQTYGYWEVRARLFKELRGDYWGAFWLMAGDSYNREGKSDGRDGVEIDIMESFHAWNDGRMTHTLHWAGYGPEHNAAGVESGHHPQLTDGEMHTYGLYWDEDLYAFTIDGAVVAVMDGMNLGDPKKLLSKGTARQPAFPKITVEAAPWAGRHYLWEKDPPKEDVFEVDYIRVYQGRLPDAMKARLLAHKQPLPAAPAEAAPAE